LLLLFLAACGSGESQPTAETQSLPEPEVTISSAPDAEEAARAYLDAWREWDYASMYEILTTLSKDAFPYEDFEARYQHVASEAALNEVSYEILQLLTHPRNAEVHYQVTLHSALVGEITRQTDMSLSLENGAWHVVWEDTLILPELAGGNTLSMVRAVPPRGNIYDQFGGGLAANTQAVAIGVIPSQVLEEEADGLVNQLATLTGQSTFVLSELIFAEDAPWYVPIAEVSAAEFDQRFDYISGYSGIRWEYYDTRLYFGGGAAPHAVGYYGSIPAEQVDEYTRLGYLIDDKIGRLGIELWGEEYLTGQRGGALYVITPEGSIATNLAEQDPQPSYSIYTTLDKNLQQQAQEAIKDFRGAIVVLERDTGRVLALVSSPGFNPNWADLADYNSQWDGYFPDEVGRFFNRATMGQYPPGSIFKPITLAAALESGLYTPQTTFYCDHEYNGLPGITLYDWTFEKELPASGELSLLEGLMRSCNPYFYDIGLSLYSNGFESLVAEMARGFGLGSPTGIPQLVEEGGQIVDAASASEAVQQAIGQGTTLITPLQAAVYVAALGNGGTLYMPQLIERIEGTDGQTIMEFQPQVNGTLPVSAENLAWIQTAMQMVVENPRGTAYRRLANLSIPTAGKTGTAQNEPNDPHAWYIGYTFAEREDLPDIAVAVIVENQGDGSDYAAPIFKRVVETYFYGRPLSLYWWESQIGVVATPEPETEATPAP